jgi:hypothetical protein
VHRDRDAVRDAGDDLIEDVRVAECQLVRVVPQSRAVSR